ncbi:hypothetical protein D5086_018222 [Populus alba]|uniref:Uncharacterized protein n=1 Tax=Populus alba TaxID=43335 RepID=A0ACC4BQF8_POPAL
MTSISQSVLMALTVTVNKFASSNVHAVSKKEGKRPPRAATRAADIGRRGVLLSTMVDVFSVNDSSTDLLRRYLKKSEENKARNDKEIAATKVRLWYFLVLFVETEYRTKYYETYSSDYFEVGFQIEKGVCNQSGLDFADLPCKNIEHA